MIPTYGKENWAVGSVWNRVVDFTNKSQVSAVIIVNSVVFESSSVVMAPSTYVNEAELHGGGGGSEHCRNCLWGECHDDHRSVIRGTACNDTTKQSFFFFLRKTVYNNMY